MKYVYVTAARSNSISNPRLSEQEQLAEYYALDAKERFPVYFISFTDNLNQGKAQSRSNPTGQSKIGINPQFKYGNPIGVYCYPLRYVFDGKDLDIPFAGDRPFIQVCKLLDKNYSRVLSDLTYNNSAFAKDARLLKKLFESGDPDLIQENTYTAKYLINDYNENLHYYEITDFNSVRVIAIQMAKGFHRCKTSIALKTLWWLTRLLAELLSDPGQKSVVTWNKILRQLGYVAVVDSGTGLIHPNEPTQALFLLNKAYKHVGTINHVEEQELDEGTPIDFANYRLVKALLKNHLASWSKDAITVNGNLSLSHCDVLNFPARLIVNGDMVLYHVDIQSSLPENLVVTGDLLFEDVTAKSSLPSNLSIGRNLTLIGSGFTTIPDNLSIAGNLDIANSEIEKLPKNLHVDGYLNLSGLDIDIPDDLYVGGNLILYDSYIDADSIPSSVHIGGEILT